MQTSLSQGAYVGAGYDDVVHVEVDIGWGDIGAAVVDVHPDLLHLQGVNVSEAPGGGLVGQPPVHDWR